MVPGCIKVPSALDQLQAARLDRTGRSADEHLVNEFVRVAREAYRSRYSGLVGVYLPLAAIEFTLYFMRYPAGALEGLPLGTAVAFHAIRGLLVVAAIVAPRRFERYAGVAFATIAAQLVVMVRAADDPDSSLYFVAALIGVAVAFASFTSIANGLLVAVCTGASISAAVYSTTDPVAIAAVQSMFAGLLLTASPLAVVWFRHNLQGARQRAEDQAHTDSLTGLLNRRGAVERMSAVVADARAQDNAVVVMVADVDHFKRINDRHGHGVGDAVLASVAAALKGSVRASDLVCRAGGEEFMVVLSATPDAGGLLAERIRAAVPLATEPTPVNITIGVCSSTPPPSPLDDVEWALGLVDRADRFLYDAKSAGRNRVLVGSI